MKISVQFRYFVCVPFCSVRNSEERVDHRHTVKCKLLYSSAAGPNFYSIKSRNTTLFYPKIKIHVSTSPYIVPLISRYTSSEN